MCAHGQHDPPAAPEGEPRSTGRRRWLFGAGVTALATGLLGFLAAIGRALVPNVLYEPPRRFPVGRPDEFPPRSATFVADRRLFVFNTEGGFFAISAICTHLGCNVVHEEGEGFACPCHGSVFDEDGLVLKGPAAWPLPRYAMSLSRRGELVVDTTRTVEPEYRFRA